MLIKRWSYVLLVFTSFLFSGCERAKDPVSSPYTQTGTTVKALTTFGSYVVLSSSGDILTWGKNLSGVCGLGVENPVSIPTKITNLENMIDIDMVEEMCLAADKSGNIWFWGGNPISSAIWPTLWSPRKISHLANVYKVYRNGYMIKRDGTVWKIDIDGNVNTKFYSPQQVAGLSDITAISGPFALQKDGALVRSGISDKATDMGGFIALNHIKQVQNSTAHTVVLKNDGTVWAWGWNNQGELGNGTFESSSEPVQALNLNNIVQISTNYGFNLALKNDGTVWFWGYTAIRDKDNNPVGMHTPVQVAGLENIKYIHANIDCMAIQNDGSVWKFNVKDLAPSKINI